MKNKNKTPAAEAFLRFVAKDPSRFLKYCPEMSIPNLSETEIRDMAFDAPNGKGNIADVVMAVVYTLKDAYRSLRRSIVDIMIKNPRRGRGTETNSRAFIS